MQALSFDNIGISYESGATASFLVLSIPDDMQIHEYQIEMLNRNRERKYLPLEVRRYNNQVNLYYNITSKLSLEQYLKRKSLKKQDFVGLLHDIAGAIINSRKLFLNYNSFFIAMEHIYVDPSNGEVYLVYLPYVAKQSVDYAMKELVLDLILNRAKLEEQEQDNYVQKIINSIRTEYFKVADLEKLLKELLWGASDEKICQEATSIIDKKEIFQARPSVEIKKEPEVEINAKGKNVNSKLLIVGLIQVLMLSIFGMLVSLKSSSGEEESLLSTIFGTILILGAVDFLIIKKLLPKKTGEHSRERTIKQPVGIKVKPEPAVSRKKENTDANNILEEIYISKFNEQQNTSLETIVINPSGPASKPYLKNINTEEKIIISKDSFIIGRLKEQVDYVLNSNAVGRTHAEVIIKQGGCYVKDLNSRNGTRVNGVRLISNQEQQLFDNDKIDIADCTFIFKTELT